jgi:chromosome segregation ATPase
MKKWLYFIFPIVLTLIFVFFYLTHVKEAKEKDRLRKIEIARVQKIEADKKAEIEEMARQDAARRAAKRAAEDAEKEAKKIADWEAVGKEIQDATDKNTAEADAFARQIANLEIELDTLRKAKEKLNAEVLTQAKAVERALIDKRTAELEVQRRTEMVRQKAASSSLTAMPVAVAPARSAPRSKLSLRPAISQI